MAQASPPPSPPPPPPPPSHWPRAIARVLSLRGHRRPSTSTAPSPPPLRSHDSVVGEHAFAAFHPPKNDPHSLKTGVKKLIRRASLSFKSERPVAVSSTKKPSRRWKPLLGDAESGIVLDEADVDETYFAVGDDTRLGMHPTPRDEHAAALILCEMLDPVHTLPAEITAQILSYLDAPALTACERVSHAWHAAARNTHVWRSVFASSHPSQFPRITPQPGRDWRKLFTINHELHRRWRKAEMSYKHLKGHTDSVYCVQFDDQKVITGSRDRSIRVWDIKSGECTRVLPPAPNEDVLGHTLSILCLQFDKTHLITGSSDTSCVVWDLLTYTPIARLSRHSAGVLDVCFDANYIVSCSKDTTICIWSRKTYQLIRRLHGHKGPVNAVAIRGNQVVSASGDAVVKLWNIETGKCVREFKGHQRGLACVQFSEDAKIIVSGGNDRDIRVWEAETGRCLRTLVGHKELVRTLHVDSVNRRIISGSYDTVC